MVRALLWASPCYPESNEGSEPSPITPCFSQMLRASALNGIEGLSMTILLRVSPTWFFVIIRPSINSIRIHLLKMMSAVGRRPYSLYDLKTAMLKFSGMVLNFTNEFVLFCV